MLPDIFCGEECCTESGHLIRKISPEDVKVKLGQRASELGPITAFKREPLMENR